MGFAGGLGGFAVIFIGRIGDLWGLHRRHLGHLFASAFRGASGFPDEKPALGPGPQARGEELKPRPAEAGAFAGNYSTIIVRPL